jgi:hypothetical protein
MWCDQLYSLLTKMCMLHGGRMSHLPLISNLLLVNFKTNTSQNETVSKVLWHLHEKDLR